MIKRPRLEWLDALRGFTMIMVVANHVAVMGFGEEWNRSSAIPFLVLFRMPLFFFVSGFLAYKATQVWNLRNLGSLVSKKLRVQIIPTIVFFFLTIAIFHKDFFTTVERQCSVFQCLYMVICMTEWMDPDVPNWVGMLRFRHSCGF